MIRKILLLLGLLSLPTMAHAEWHKAVSSHFVVYADEDADALSDYAEKLERYDSAARTLRNLPKDAAPASRRVTVFLVPTGEFYAIFPRRVGGITYPRATGTLIFMPSDGDDSTLFHEYTHHQLALAWAGLSVPGWLNEGMAQAQATAEFRSDGSVVFGRELEYAEYMLADMDSGDMRTMLNKSTAGTGETNYYSIGWLLTHMLTFDNKRQGQLIDYLVALNKGQSAPEAAETAFGDLKKLGSDLQRYRRAASLPGVVVPADQITVGPIEVTKLTAGEAATIIDAIHSQAGVDEEKAATLYTKAVADAAPYPNDAGAQRMLAEAAFDAKQFDVALEAANRAIAANPKTDGAYYYKAEAMKELGEDADAQRAVIDEGLIEQPDSPSLMRLYYKTYMGGNEPAPLLAKTYLVQAYKLAPQDPGLRMETASMLLTEDKGAEARALLRPVAYSVHRSKAAEHALAAIAAIDEGDLERAQTELSKQEDEDEMPDDGAEG